MAGRESRALAVVLPSYNPGPELQWTLDSLRAQTVPFKLFLVDDGSDPRPDYAPLLAGFGEPQCVRSERERRDGDDDVEEEGGGGQADLDALHVELSIDERAEDLEPRDEVGAVARELALRHAELGAFGRDHRRRAERARRP